MTRYKKVGQTSLRNKQTQLDMMRNQKNSNDYLKQMPRRWDAGDVYSPHDMSPVEMQKWRKRSPRGGDVVDALGIRPLDMYKVWALDRPVLSETWRKVTEANAAYRTFP